MVTSGTQFLHQIYGDLHKNYRRTKKSVALLQKPIEKIDAWLMTLKKTHMSHGNNPKVLERLKKYYHKKYVIAINDIPESYYENFRRVAYEQGYGYQEIYDEVRDNLAMVIIADQKSTLNNWIEYLCSEVTGHIPVWVKYWIFMGMVKLSTYDQEKHIFRKRRKDTIAPFPELNRESLSYVVEAILKIISPDTQKSISDGKLQKLLKSPNFNKLYSWAMDKVKPIEKSILLETRGQWIRFPQYSDHIALAQSIEGYGTGWCIAAPSTAKNYIKGGDFYIYYSRNRRGKPEIPRIAIRMLGQDIQEIRGIAEHQNLDPYIGSFCKLIVDLKC